MERVGSEYGAVEWTIENFSCWNEEIHNEVITSLKFLGEFFFEICPRGGSWQMMSLKILGDSRTEISGDLSLIASNGYVFCSGEVVIDSQRPAFELSSAPMFEDVVSRSQMNDGLHKDQFTLRFRMRDAVSDSVLYMRTVICVHEFSLRISGEAIYNMCLYGTPSQRIRTIEYPTNDGASAKIYLYVGFDPQYRYTQIKNLGLYHPGGMYFNISPFGSRKSAFIHTRISVIGKNGKVLRSEANERLRSDMAYAVSSILTRTEVEVMTYLLWRLRIIPENKSELLCTYNTTDQGQKLPTGSLCRPTYNTCVEKPTENIKVDISNQPENSLSVLSKDFMCLYQDQKFSDITLKCDSVTFPVHKVILSARSPVFDRLLSSDMQEAASGQVDIGDLDPSTLALFLTYLYTGAVEEELQSERALKLYYAADKYQVPSLKKECAEFLCSNVSISNVCDLLSLADRHHDDQITWVAHEFILKNFNEVLSSDEWGSLVKSDPVLVAKTVTYLAQKKYVG